MTKGKSIRNSFLNKANNGYRWKKHAIEKLKLDIGYHEKIKPRGSIKSREILFNKFNQNIEKISFIGRFGVPFTVFKGIPDCEPKGIFIAIHGRSSAPDYVMGMYNKDDYTRSFGTYWLKEGYIVYAPQVDWNHAKVSSLHGLPMRKLGYSCAGADLAKLFDIIAFIKKNSNDSVKSIIVGGISYGSLLSEWCGAISEDIDAVISIGGSARGDPFIGCDDIKGKINPEKVYYNSYLPPDYYLYYNGIGIYKIIAPKPLVISIGTHDHGECKFEMIFSTLEYYNKIGFNNRVSLNLFKGFHEADPEGEISSYKRLEIN